MRNILYANCPGLSPVMSAQFAEDYASQAKTAKKSLKHILKFKSRLRLSTLVLSKVRPQCLIWWAATMFMLN